MVRHTYPLYLRHFERRASLGAPLSPIHLTHWTACPPVAVLRQAELQLLERPSAKASALVAALRKRYAATATEYPAKKNELDLSYAAAMRNVSHMFPSDHHIASFFADALMNTMPWDYYVEGRAAVGHKLRPAAAEAREVLEQLLQAEPTHEGGKLQTNRHFHTRRLV
jgi:hypothetical protein